MGLRQEEKCVRASLRATHVVCSAKMANVTLKYLPQQIMRFVRVGRAMWNGPCKPEFVV